MRVSCDGLVLAAAPLDIRPTEAGVEGAGVVVMYNEARGEWQAVCAGSLGGREADIACRQLGYVGGTIGKV